MSAAHINNSSTLTVAIDPPRDQGYATASQYSKQPPGTIDQNQQLLVQFHNLDAHDVVVLGSAKLVYILPDLTNYDQTVVQNLVMLWLKGPRSRSMTMRENTKYQGIFTSDKQNVCRIQVGAKNVTLGNTIETAITNAWYYASLDFELLHSHTAFYQSALA